MSDPSPTPLTHDIAGVAEVDVCVPAADAAEYVESFSVPEVEVVVDPHEKAARIVLPHRLEVLLDAAVVKGAVRGGLAKFVNDDKIFLRV